MSARRMIPDTGGRVAVVLLLGLVTMVLGWLIFGIHPAIGLTWGAAVGFCLTLLPETAEERKTRLAREREQMDRDLDAQRRLTKARTAKAEEDLRAALLEQATLHVLERNLRRELRPPGKWRGFR